MILVPQTLNPKPENPKTLNPKPKTRDGKLLVGDSKDRGDGPGRLKFPVVRGSLKLFRGGLNDSYSIPF